MPEQVRQGSDLFADLFRDLLELLGEGYRINPATSYLYAMPDSVNFFVYIITNKNNSVLYTGFTDDLERRVYEHRNKVYKGFAYKYNCHKLVYFEEFIDKDQALHRERQLKKYRREWKENLINSNNPDWRDLYEDFMLG